MNKRPEIWLITSLMMFPQIVETIYSPVLPNIATAFNVSQQAASQTLSLYFVAFAVGVIIWGRLADIIGRKPSMLLGLMSYAVGSIIAINSQEFEYLLLARSLSAFGAAVGSIVTQTMLRDCFQGPELGKVFSIMGMGIGISPALGLILGGLLASLSGHRGVFLALGLLAITLLLLCVWRLPETENKRGKPTSLRVLAIKMGKDTMIWRNAILVASFNLMLFSYYSLAPFMFTQLGLNQKQFGASGIVLAIGVLIGSATNKHLISKGWQGEALVFLAAIAALIGAIGVYLSQSNLFFLLPMMLVVIGFGIAIPNILSQALVNYKEAAGTAGALFGLIYYLILGGGLSLAALNHNLAQVLFCSALVCVLLSLKKR